MEFLPFACGDLPVAVNISRFRGLSGVGEVHLVLRPTEHGSIELQLDWLQRAYCNALAFIGIDARAAVLRRFFCEDLSNQAPALEARPFSNARGTNEPCAISWAGQPPADHAKVALWAYLISDPNGELDKTQESNSLTLERGELSHHWTTGITCANGDAAYAQTYGIFEKYDAFLRTRNLSVADNVIRTWLFVREIDADYKGLVDARREFFAERGLTRDTHYIASTGIEGEPADSGAKVAMDAYAIAGVQPEQIDFIKALDHLSPTHIYGVTFERATSVAYRDRKHVIISGTASIDRRGNILYPGDVSRQLDRALENVEALLKQAGATLEDMCVLIAYLCNPSDHALVRRRLQERLGDTPIAVVAAAICRSGWLIEIEGQAIVPACNRELPTF